MHVDLVQGRVDVARLVLEHLDLDPGRQRGRGQRQVLLDRGDGRHRVGAGLSAHLEDHRPRPVEAGDRALLLGPVLGPAEIADPHRHPADRGHHHVVEGLGVGQPPHGPERVLARRAGDVAARQPGVLALERVAHGGAIPLRVLVLRLAEVEVVEERRPVDG